MKMYFHRLNQALGRYVAAVNKYERTHSDYDEHRLDDARANVMKRTKERLPEGETSEQIEILLEFLFNAPYERDVERGFGKFASQEYISHQHREAFFVSSVIRAMEVVFKNDSQYHSITHTDTANIIDTIDAVYAYMEDITWLMNEVETGSISYTDGADQIYQLAKNYKIVSFQASFLERLSLRDLVQNTIYKFMWVSKDIPPKYKMAYIESLVNIYLSPSPRR